MIRNAAFGLEHPLVTVNSLQEAGASYLALGFQPTKVTHHPWGTDNRLVMLDGNFIELIAVGERAKIDTDAEGGYKFARHLAAFLDDGHEGASLLALHSHDIDRDVAAAHMRGLEPNARFRFRRHVELPDGTVGDADVSLATFIIEGKAQVSHFLVKQHRPQMVFNSAWMNHPNGARRIAYCVYAAQAPLDLLERFALLFGPEKIVRDGQGFEVATGGGAIAVMSWEEASVRFGADCLPRGPELEARIVAIGVDADLSRAADYVFMAGGRLSNHGLIVPAAAACNVALVFSDRHL